MPHASLPSPGFQAVILCGPGASLDTFTSDPAEFPKAIIPVANRPMVWYPLDWCYRSGITDIILVSPNESKKAIEAALSQNPHLTTLPSPRPTVIAPDQLTTTSGTGEVFRQPELREAITGDFIVLPCDLVTELPGISLIQEWMVLQSSFGGAASGKDLDTGAPNPLSTSGEKMGRRGGLGVWYETKTENGIKGEQTDFIATVSSTASIVPATKASLRNEISQLVYSLPTDSLNDKVESDKGLRIRRSLLSKFRNVSMRTSMRDAHIYVLPYWALEFMQNDHFESVSEDVLGWWARATWQDQLVSKLNLDKIFVGPATSPSESEGNLLGQASQDINVADYSSTSISSQKASNIQLASRTHTTLSPPTFISVPPFLAYKHPEKSSLIIKRVDTTPSLLHVSLELAKLPDLNSGDSTSSLAHPLKIAHPDLIPRNSRVESTTCLVAENTTFGEQCNIKESVIGAGCTIGEGVRLVKCVIMDYTTIGNNVTLSGCVVGSRSHIQGGGRKDPDKTDLRDCEVQGGYVMAWGTEAKNEKFAKSGLDEENHEGDDSELVTDGE